MRIRNVWIDGGSFFLGAILLVGTLGRLYDHLFRGKPFDHSYWYFGFSLLASAYFFWLAFRIGSNRKKLREVRRWMGEVTDK